MRSYFTVTPTMYVLTANCDYSTKSYLSQLLEGTRSLLVLLSLFPLQLEQQCLRERRINCLSDKQGFNFFLSSLFYLRLWNGMKRKAMEPSGKTQTYGQTYRGEEGSKTLK